MIPVEMGFPTMRAQSFASDANDDMLLKGLDLVEERRESAMVRLACYQQKLKRGYDSRVRSRPLAPGDLILKKVVGIARDPSWGKLGPNWEGPYRITSVPSIGSYYLADLENKLVKRP